MKFEDSENVNLDAEEITLSKRKRLPKDAERGSEFINREEKTFE